MNDSTKPADQVRSKILRLGFRDRMEFNRLVRDRIRGPVLIVWLAEHGVPDVSARNLSKYKRSPAYKGWLAEQTAVERDRETGENAMRLAEAMGGCASDKLRSMLAGKLYQFVTAATPEDLNRLVPAVRAVIEAERFHFEKRKAVEIALQICADQTAKDIVANPDLTNDKKTDLIGRQIFGEDW